MRSRFSILAFATNVACLVTLLLLLAPGIAGAQPIAAADRAAQTEVGSSSFGTLSNARLLDPSPSLGDPRLQVSFDASTEHKELPSLADPNFRRRLVPYYVAGVVLGGAIGFVIDRSAYGVERKDDCYSPVCPLVPYTFTIIGAGAGSVTGIVIGYLRER